jgi:ATP-dependent exoDNAse (exonuclease V) alpha subunit
LAEAGRSVVALAQSVQASRETLRNEAGFANADTVARFLKDEQMQQTTRDGVILVDEASQLGSRDTAQLFDLADQLNARVILVGDVRQHRAVSAGEPLKLLEEKAGLRVAEVTEILRQEGDYKKAAEALSEGRVEEAFQELDKLGWIKEVDDAERYQELATAYLKAAAEKKPDGTPKSALVVAPTHAEGHRVTDAIRDGLKANGKLKKERMVTAYVPAHLTDAQKTDATQYDADDLIQFTQNTKGYGKGARIIVGEGTQPPTELADRFEVYRPTQLALAVGDRIRVTAGGSMKDGKRFSNGTLMTVEGFTKGSDIIVGKGKVIDKDFGHLTHGYAVTSYASQGATVNKVIIAIASESVPATNQRSAYVAITRGREQALVFTDDREELLKAISRPDDPLSATQLSESTQGKRAERNGKMKRLTLGRMQASMQPTVTKNKAQRGLDHEQ